MSEDRMLPVKWKEWDLVDHLSVNLYSCTFLEDFGVFRRGTYVDTLYVNYHSGRLIAYDEFGNEGLTQRIRAIALGGEDGTPQE